LSLYTDEKTLTNKRAGTQLKNMLFRCSSENIRLCFQEVINKRKSLGVRGKSFYLLLNFLLPDFALCSVAALFFWVGGARAAFWADVFGCKNKSCSSNQFAFGKQRGRPNANNNLRPQLSLETLLPARNRSPVLFLVKLRRKEVYWAAQKFYSFCY
jgi:hypothetical protein